MALLPKVVQMELVVWSTLWDLEPHGRWALATALGDSRLSQVTVKDDPSHPDSNMQAADSWPACAGVDFHGPTATAQSHSFLGNSRKTSKEEVPLSQGSSMKEPWLRHKGTKTLWLPALAGHILFNLQTKWGATAPACLTMLP